VKKRSQYRRAENSIAIKEGDLYGKKVVSYYRAGLVASLSVAGCTNNTSSSKAGVEITAYEADSSFVAYSGLGVYRWVNVSITNHGQGNFDP
jgi:hypothetical protein